VSFRKQAKQAKVESPFSTEPLLSVSDWSIAELSSLYSEYRSSLNSQARRMLHSESDAAEIVQEAFLKFILAAPELDTKERAIAYLRTTVNNLSLNKIRASGVRAGTVPLDSDSIQGDLDELAATNHVPFDSTIILAEDASIVREALSRLSSDQRTALIMWDMEGRSTEEIATALNTTPSNVRHIVSRSRSSFVRVLSEWVIDESTGTTALDSLSSSYKKAAELARKSAKAMPAIIFLIAATFGLSTFNNKTITPITPASSTKIVSQVSPNASASPNASSALNAIPTLPIKKTLSPKTNTASSNNRYSGLSKLDTLVPTVDAKIPGITFSGVGSDGVPIGFTVTDLTGDTGKIIIGKPVPVITNDSIVLTAPAVSYDPKAVNVILNQVITVNGAGTTYTPTVSISMKGNWVALDTSTINTYFTRLPNGDYLVSSTLITVSPTFAGLDFPVSQGVDVTSIPSSVSVRLVLDPSKTKILAESIKISANGVSK
jgi:RNA polymerase sigma factor (sigma-70 family)